MDVYDKGLEERMAEWEVKKYKSHRRSPANFLNKSSNLTSYRFQFFGGLIYYYKKYSDFKTFQLSVEACI